MSVRGEIQCEAGVTRDSQCGPGLGPFVFNINKARYPGKKGKPAVVSDPNDKRLSRKK